MAHAHLRGSIDIDAQLPHGISHQTARPRSPASLVLSVDELLIMIIEFADRATIKTCVSCCRRWYALGRHSLWRFLRFSTAPASVGSRAEFLQKVIARYEGTRFLGIENINTIESLPFRFQSQFPDTLTLVRHVSIDLAMPYDRADASREVTHFLGQVFAVGYLLSACKSLRSLHVRLGLAHRAPQQHVQLSRSQQSSVVLIEVTPQLLAQSADDGYAHLHTPFIQDFSTPTASSPVSASTSPSAPVAGIFSSQDDILDDADEETIGINVSRMLLPAIRVLEVMLKRCQFANSIRISWSLDVPFPKPARLLLAPTITASTATAPAPAPAHATAPAHAHATTHVSDKAADSRHIDPAASTSPGSVVQRSRAASGSQLRITRFAMSDASSTSPRKLTELLCKLPSCDSICIRHGSITTSVISVLERRASALRHLHLPTLHTLDEDSFFNSLLSRAARLESLDVSNATILFRVRMRTPALRCPSLRSLNISNIPHLHGDFFAALAAGCPLLQSLTCRGNPNMTDADLCLVASECRFLTRLDVSGCSRLTMASLHAVAEARLAHLTHLAIEDVASVIDTSGHLGRDSLVAMPRLSDASPRLASISFGVHRRSDDIIWSWRLLLQAITELVARDQTESSSLGSTCDGDIDAAVQHAILAHGSQPHALRRVPLFYSCDTLRSLTPSMIARLAACVPAAASQTDPATVQTLPPMLPTIRSYNAQQSRSQAAAIQSQQLSAEQRQHDLMAGSSPRSSPSRGHHPSTSASAPATAAASASVAYPLRRGRIPILPGGISTGGAADTGSAGTSDDDNGNDDDDDRTPLVSGRAGRRRDGRRAASNRRSCCGSKPSLGTGNGDDDDDVPSWREQLAYQLDSSPYGRWWDIADAAINTVFVATYIVMTTYSHGKRQQDPPPQPPPQFLEDFDCAVAVALLLQWVPRLYISVEPLANLRSMFAIFSLVTTIPVIWSFIMADYFQHSFLEGGVFVFVYPLRFWRLHMAIGNCLRPGQNVVFRLSPVMQKGLNLGLSIFNTLFTVTAWVHICLYIFQKYYDLSFFDVFYTIAVSSTSGLNTQIIPDNIFSRIITLYVMIVGAIFIPTNLSDLIVLIRSQSPFNKRYKPSSGQTHVLLLGNFEVASLRDFFREFFCDDHGLRTMSTRIVMLNPNEPSEELQALLSDPIHINRTQYVKGSAMSFHSLHKVQAGRAEAAFILSSRHSDQDPNEEDAKSVMRALALRKYHSRLKIFAQILLPANKTHLLQLADHTLCIDEFVMGMLAQNCLAPGFSTLMYLLTTSIPDRAIASLRLKDPPQWIREYFAGATMEIVKPPTDDDSETDDHLGDDNGHDGVDSGDEEFSDREAQPEPHQPRPSRPSKPDPLKSNHRIIFNPVNYIMQGGETAYIITKHSRIADKIATEGLNWLDQAANSSTGGFVALDFGNGFGGNGSGGSSNISGTDWRTYTRHTSINTFLSPEQVEERVKGYLEARALARAQAEKERGEAARQADAFQNDDNDDLKTPVPRSFTRLADRSVAPSDMPDPEAPNLDGTTLSASSPPFVTESTAELNASLTSLDSVESASSSSSTSSGTPKGARSAKRRKKPATDELIVLRGGAADATDIDEEPPTAEQVLQSAFGGSNRPASESPVAGSPKSAPQSPSGKKKRFMSNLFNRQSILSPALPSVAHAVSDMTSASGASGAKEGSQPVSPRADAGPSSAGLTSSPPSTPRAGKPRDSQPGTIPYTAPSPQPVQPADPNAIPDDITGHVVVCSLADEFPPNLAYFIAPFRHKDQTRPVVLLCTTPPSDDEWTRLVAFRNMYYIVGTPLMRRDLRRAHVQRASRAVVLANPRHQAVVDRAADAPALLALLNIQTMCSAAAVQPVHVPTASSHHAHHDPDRQHGTGEQEQEPPKTFIMVEFVHRENMKFVGASSSSLAAMSARIGIRNGSDVNDIHGQNAIPAFVGGHVFSQSLFHSILCQTYYNEHLLRVMRMFMFNGVDNRSAAPSGVSDPAPVPRHRSFPPAPLREAFSFDMLRSIPPSGAPLTRQNTFAGTALGEDHGNFFQVVLPPDDRFVGLPYGSLFMYLLVKYNAVSLGLYRRTVETRRSSSSGVGATSTEAASPVSNGERRDSRSANDESPGSSGASASSPGTTQERGKRRAGSRPAQVVKYVVVNPAPDLVVKRDDAVYLVASKVPVWDEC
ncbi:hypothetical protein BC831DRAFT_504492 [Entophlyctis helioformis]|nr:hypothetical protein BC831DRAFT_504492 [Entophlyctis helioformis]